MPDLTPIAQHGGIAGAITATAVALTAFWLGIAATLWRVFLEPQRLRDQQRCAEDVRRLEDRIKELETLLLMHGNGPLRQAMQLVASEAHMDAARARQALDPLDEGIRATRRTYDNARRKK